MYLFGGICLWVSCIMAWLVGDVLSMVTYAAFGSFSLVFGFNTQPTQLVAQTLGGPTSASMNDAIGTLTCTHIHQRNSLIVYFFSSHLCLGLLCLLPDHGPLLSSNEPGPALDQHLLLPILPSGWRRLFQHFPSSEFGRRLIQGRGRLRFHMHARTLHGNGLYCSTETHS